MERKRHMQTQLTPEQIQKLRETLQGHHLEAIITLALVTGMRRDELLRLQWQDIDLEQGEVRVHSTKMKNSTRLLRISTVEIEMLKQHRLHQLEAQQKDGTVGPELDLVFPDQTGGAFRPEQLVQGWYEVLDQAALPVTHFHTLRLVVGQALREQIRGATEEHDGKQENDEDTNP